MQITREALYEHVWSRPLKTVAAEYGVTPSVLSELCRQHHIPTPPLGHWTKREMGLPYVQPPLGPPPENSELAAMPLTILKARPPHSETPHPALARSLERLSASITRAGLVSCGGQGCFPIKVAPANVDRAVRILSQLIRAAEACGWTVDQSGEACRFIVEGEPIGITLTEKVSRVPHVQTEADRQALRLHERRRLGRTAFDSAMYRLGPPKIAKWDKIPTGCLQLGLSDRRTAQVRQAFSDAKTQRLEQLLPAVVRALAAQAAYIKRSRVNLEAATAAATKRERLQREANQRKALDAKRIDFLEARLAAFERSMRIEAFIAALRSSDVNASDVVTAFTAWAADYAADLRRASVDTLNDALKDLGLTDVAADSGTESEDLG